MFTSHAVKIGETAAKGRGVFAVIEIARDSIIEIAPVITIPREHRGVLDGTVLYNYYFSWGCDLLDAAICLGFGSLYNHSYTPNARYVKKIEEGCIAFIALRFIECGEEITVNYNGDPDCTKPIWFEPAQ